VTGLAATAGVAGEAGRGNAAKAGTITSGAGARWPSEACGRTWL
jgi:hypothetical protein